MSSLPNSFSLSWRSFWTFWIINSLMDDWSKVISFELAKLSFKLNCFNKASSSPLRFRSSLCLFQEYMWIKDHQQFHQPFLQYLSISYHHVKLFFVVHILLSVVCSLRHRNLIDAYEYQNLSFNAFLGIFYSSRNILMFDRLIFFYTEPVHNSRYFIGAEYTQ